MCEQLVQCRHREREKERHGGVAERERDLNALKFTDEHSTAQHSEEEKGGELKARLTLPNRA